MLKSWSAASSRSQFLHAAGQPARRDRRPQGPDADRLGRSHQAWGLGRGGPYATFLCPICYFAVSHISFFWDIYIISLDLNVFQLLKLWKSSTSAIVLWDRMTFSRSIGIDYRRQDGTLIDYRRRRKNLSIPGFIQCTLWLPIILSEERQNNNMTCMQIGFRVPAWPSVLREGVNLKI